MFVATCSIITTYMYVVQRLLSSYWNPTIIVCSRMQLRRLSRKILQGFPADWGLVVSPMRILSLYTL